MILSIPRELYKKIITYLSLKDINCLKLCNKELYSIFTLERENIIRNIYKNEKNQILVVGLTPSNNYIDFPFLEKIIGFNADFLNQYIIGFYQGKTIMIDDQLYPYGPFKFFGVLNNGMSQVSYYILISGSLTPQEKYLYPQLDGLYSYEKSLFIFHGNGDGNGDGNGEGYEEILQKDYFPIIEVKNILNKWFQNDRYLILENDDIELIELIELYDKLIRETPNKVVYGLNCKYKLVRLNYKFGNLDGNCLFYENIHADSILIKKFDNGSLIYGVKGYIYELNFNIKDYFEDYQELLKFLAKNLTRLFKIYYSDGSIVVTYEYSQNKNILLSTEFLGKKYDIYLLNPIVNGVEFENTWELQNLTVNNITRLTENKSDIPSKITIYKDVYIPKEGIFILSDRKIYENNKKNRIINNCFDYPFIKL